MKLPGRFYELNIHYGLFVGGLGDFREIFLGLWDNFRGCLNDLQYNGVDVLARAKERDKALSQQAGLSISSTAIQVKRRHKTEKKLNDSLVGAYNKWTADMGNFYGPPPLYI